MAAGPLDGEGSRWAGGGEAGAGGGVWRGVEEVGLRGCAEVVAGGGGRGQGLEGRQRGKGHQLARGVALLRVRVEVVTTVRGRQPVELVADSQDRRAGALLLDDALPRPHRVEHPPPCEATG